MMSFISSLENAFQENSHSENAFAMAKYMKNNFIFFGIKNEDRRRILKAVWNDNQEEVAKNNREIALELFDKKQREFHYCAVEILIKQLKKKYKKEDIHLIEKLLITNSWWDNVDSIAKKYPWSLFTGISR